jgi:hypothetical protein
VKDFNQILDECIDRINRGETLASCLADYPEHARELKPMLNAMADTRTAYSFTPADEAKRAARIRFLNALEKRRQPSLWQRILGQRMVWATVATILVIMIAGYFGLRTTVFPGQPPSEVISASNSAGNFVFLVSDEVNAIADFDNVMVTIDKVGLLKSDEPAKWLEFVPEVKTFDLALLPGATTQELWRGDIPQGQYTKVFIYVSQVSGLLKGTTDPITIKLPSNKLQISRPFQVTADAVTSFTYDITVMSTGQGQAADKYHLKPQIGESGASQKPAPDSQDNSKGKKSENSPEISVPSPVNNKKK